MDGVLCVARSRWGILLLLSLFKSAAVLPVSRRCGRAKREMENDRLIALKQNAAVAPDAKLRDADAVDFFFCFDKMSSQMQLYTIRADCSADFFFAH